MFASWQLLALASTYIGALFAIAWVAERRAQLRPAGERPVVYALALAVYCTAWTFYGAVGHVADDGWSYLPIYLGPILLFVFGGPLLRRLIAICKAGRLTSVADFIGARFGSSVPLAVAATCIALLAGLPYLALQLRGISLGFEVLASDGGRMLAGTNSTTIITVLLAAFAMLFGARHVASTESHQGMVLAVAVESLVKLFAFLAVGGFAIWSLGGVTATAGAVAALPTLAPAQLAAPPFWIQTLLAAAAVLVLPRQFHLMVVENIGPRELRTAQWLFPIYLLLFALFVLPLAAAGAAILGDTGADRYVLSLPQVSGQEALSLLAFLGGFSAATGMVIVSCVALATMLSNEIIIPALLRAGGYTRAAKDLGALLLRVRRITIAVLLLLAWLIDRQMSAEVPLAMIGLLSFSAIAHLAPPVVAGVLWHGANRSGATAGLTGGMAVWTVTTLLPSLFPDVAPQLAPRDVLVQGAALSLSVHVLLLISVSLSTSSSLSEQVGSARLLGLRQPQPADRSASGARVADLIVLLERFFGNERTHAFLSEYASRAGRAPEARAVADAHFIQFCEGCLASALGGASARALVNRALRPAGGDVVEIIEQTSRAVRFNRELLQTTLNHMDQGVSVVDEDLRLIAWNEAYQKLFGFPDVLLRVGTPISALIRFNAERGLFGDGASEDAVERRMSYLQQGLAYHNERHMPDGRVIDITGNPWSRGGFVTTFTDVTAYKRSERLLQTINEELEQRVATRTRELVSTNQALRQENEARARAEAEARRARREAEAISRSKSRFLAATTHDLAQPLNAARLFSHSLNNSSDPQAQTALDNIGRSLAAMEELLDGLAEFSRLDAGAQPVKLRSFPIGELLQPLATEFAAVASESGLQLHLVPCSAHVHSDPALLRRIVQNLLSNAVRYTSSGRIVLGCRRRGSQLRIEVHDTGPGIAAEKQREIFEEFRRLGATDARGKRGLGLGLAISERMARLLNHPLGLHSRPGRGSCFHVTVPRAAAAASPGQAEPPRTSSQQISGLRILVLDNDRDTLTATAALLARWQCTAITARDDAEAMEKTAHDRPDVALVDYQLDEGRDGISAIARLRDYWGAAVPAVLITASTLYDLRDSAAEADMQFLAKPVKPAALRALLQQMMLRHRRSDGAQPHADARR